MSMIESRMLPIAQPRPGWFQMPWSSGPRCASLPSHRRPGRFRAGHAGHDPSSRRSRTSLVASLAGQARQRPPHDPAGPARHCAPGHNAGPAPVAASSEPPERSRACARPVMPGRTLQRTFQSPGLYSARCAGTSGRGPTRLISPLSTLINWGSSSMLVRRMNRPTRVIRGSSVDGVIRADRRRILAPCCGTCTCRIRGPPARHGSA